MYRSQLLISRWQSYLKGIILSLQASLCSDEDAEKRTKDKSLKGQLLVVYIKALEERHFGR